MVFKIKEIQNKTRDRLPPLRGLQKSKITVELIKVNALFSKIKVSNISEVNDLFYAGACVK